MHVGYCETPAPLHITCASPLHTLCPHLNVGYEESPGAALAALPPTPLHTLCPHLYIGDEEAPGAALAQQLAEDLDTLTAAVCRRVWGMCDRGVFDCGEKGRVSEIETYLGVVAHGQLDGAPRHRRPASLSDTPSSTPTAPLPLYI